MPMKCQYMEMPEHGWTLVKQGGEGGGVEGGAGEGGDGQLARLQTSEGDMATGLTAMQSIHYTTMAINCM